MSDENRLYLHYEENRTGGEREEPDEMFSTRTPSFVTVDFFHLSKEAPETFFCNSVEVSKEVFNSEEAYLAVVFYSDEDTFGQTHGLWERIGVYSTEEEAMNAIRLARSPMKSKNISYKPWDGYFAKYDRDEVFKLEIK